MSTSSVLETEVSHFATLGQKWWDPQGPFAPLHAMNPVRLNYIKTHVISQSTSSERIRDTHHLITPLSSYHILDVGCGGGLLSEPLARMGAAVTGIDATQESISAASSHADLQGLDITYRCAAAETLLSEDGTDQFDVICALEIIEHVADPLQFITTLAQLLKPGGHLFVSTLNRTALSFALGIIGAEYITRIVPRGTHDWRKFQRPHEIARMCRKTGLSVDNVSGLFYMPLTQTWHLTPNRTRINYILHATRETHKSGVFPIRGKR